MTSIETKNQKIIAQLRISKLKTQEFTKMIEILTLLKIGVFFNNQFFI
jgi:hypothetical protein